MDQFYNVDVKEQAISEYNVELLKLLLQDKTTNKNIKWCCNNYAEYGDGYQESDEMQTYLIIGRHGDLIQPRVAKSKEDQVKRTRDNAEVFTPSWVCNEQNNLIDEQWFGKDNVFNISNRNSWITNVDPIEFSNLKGKSWKDYVNAKRLEITCGEAPYLASRYDTVSGEMINVENRIGLLDRKLRIINENTDNEEEWFEWVIRAYQAIYGFEFQGDNILLARENMLFTFMDNMKYKFKKDPTIEQMIKIASIIVWNIWQMDGLNYSVPFGNGKPKPKQMDFMSMLFDDVEEESLEDSQDYEPVYCQIKNWRSNRIELFKDMVKGD